MNNTVLFFALLSAAFTPVVIVVIMLRVPKANRSNKRIADALLRSGSLERRK